MLVLSRKENERIVIGHGEIEIVVCEIRDGRVRLGITAPREVPVHRGEIHKLIVDAARMEVAELTRSGG